MPNQHKTAPKAVRMPDGLPARVEEAARECGQTVNAFIVAAIEEKLQRRAGGSATPAIAPRAHAVNCKCGICRPKNGVR